MAQPETREVNRCTYTPVVNSAEVEDNDPAFTARQPFATHPVNRAARAGKPVSRHIGCPYTHH